MISLVYKGFCKLYYTFRNLADRFYTTIKFHGNHVHYTTFATTGVPYVMVARSAEGLFLGKGFSMHNGANGNPIGCFQPCTFFIDRRCSIKIGENVGISQTALIAHADITIGNNVKIGGGTCVYTSDFHSLDSRIRCSNEDQEKRNVAPIHIGNNVFIGAHSIILKGVIIGDNSIIGAGSVVTKSIPANQIWAGNPAKYIRDCQ